MPNKSHAAWESTKSWCIANPGKTAGIAMIDGMFTLTWNPKPERLLGVVRFDEPVTPAAPEGQD